MSAEVPVADTPFVNLPIIPPVAWGQPIGPIYVGDWAGLEVFYTANVQQDTKVRFTWAPGPPSGPLSPTQVFTNPQSDDFDVVNPATHQPAASFSSHWFVKAKGTWVTITPIDAAAIFVPTGSLFVVGSNRSHLPLVPSASGLYNASSPSRGQLIPTAASISVPATSTTTLYANRLFAGRAKFGAFVPANSGGFVAVYAAQIGQVGTANDAQLASIFNPTGALTAPTTQEVFLPTAIVTVRLVNNTAGAFTFQAWLNSLEE